MMAAGLDITRTYDSWADWLAHVQQAPPADLADPKSMVPDSPDGFRGTRNWAEAWQLATEGWKAAIADSETFSRRIEERITADRFQTSFEPRYDVAGAQVDIARFLSGEPECMVEAEPIRIAKLGRAVRLVVNIGARSDVAEHKIRARGAALLALADVLARAQHPLEVWAVSTVDGNADGRRLTYWINVHAASEPLDLGKIMFALAHPSSLRRLVFRARELEPRPVRNNYRVTAGTYGSSADVGERELPDHEGYSIVLPRIDARDDWSEAASLQWIEDQLDTIFGAES